MYQGAPTYEGQREALGYRQMIMPAGAVNLTPIVGARFALIQVEVASVRWINADADPTTTFGSYIDPDGELRYVSDLYKIRLIRVSAGAILNVQYFK